MHTNAIETDTDKPAQTSTLKNRKSLSTCVDMGSNQASWSLARGIAHVPGQAFRLLYLTVPVGSPSRGGDVTVYVWNKPTELAHSFLFSTYVCFCLYSPFSCIPFCNFAQRLSAFSLCSSGLISALLVFSTVYLFMKVPFSPDVTLCGWLGLKHQLTNCM